MSDELKADARFPGALIHTSSYIRRGRGCTGSGTRIWHFSHILGQALFSVRIALSARM